MIRSTIERALLVAALALGLTACSSPVQERYELASEELEDCLDENGDSASACRDEQRAFSEELDEYEDESSRYWGD